jgi:hypothetical protein
VLPTQRHGRKMRGIGRWARLNSGQNRVGHVKQSESFVELLLSKLSNPLKAGLPFCRACPARAKIIELSTPGHANKKTPVHKHGNASLEAPSLTFRYRLGSRVQRSTKIRTT